MWRKSVGLHATRFAGGAKTGFRKTRAHSVICNWPTNQFFLESLMNTYMSFNKALAVQSNPSTYCSYKNQEVGSAHHYPALVIIQSRLWPDPNSPSLVNIVKCEPQCTVILPPIPPHQETKTRNKQREGKRIWPFCILPFVPLAWWLWGLQKWKWNDWACSVRLVAAGLSCANHASWPICGCVY